MEADLICINCKHYNIDKNNCQAFKNGIPEIIWVGSDDHSSPLPDQENDIVFEPKNDRLTQ